MGNVVKLDDAERHARGELPADPQAGAKPMNEAARRAEAETPRVLTVRQVMQAAMERAMAKAPVGVCTTGHYKLDQLLGGMQPGRSYVLGADTSWGKSSMVVALTDDNIRAGRKVLIVSTEDDESVYGERLVIRRTNITADAMRLKKLGHADYSAMTEAVNSGEDMPVFLDARGRKAEWVVKQVVRLIEEHGIQLAVLDYLQELDSARKHQDRRLEVKYVASLFRMACKRAGIASLLVSQLTVQDEDKPPTKHSLRDSKDIAIGTEGLLLGFKPPKDIVRNGQVIMHEGVRYVFVAKNKGGPAGRFVPMEWDEQRACFNTTVDPETARYERMAQESNELGAGMFDNEYDDESERRFP